LRKMGSHIDVNEGRLVCDLIKKVGPGRHYLEEAHTMDHFRAYWRPGLFNRDMTFGNEDSAGDIAARAQSFIREHLAKEEPDILDEKLASELEKMVQAAIEDE
jgi:trimethylamine:corrinoid methyltransferase-like protein